MNTNEEYSKYMQGAYQQIFNTAILAQDKEQNDSQFKSNFDRKFLIYIDSFNENIAKPFIDNIKRMTPERFSDYAKGYMELKEMNTGTQTVDLIPVEFLISTEGKKWIFNMLEDIKVSTNLSFKQDIESTDLKSVNISNTSKEKINSLVKSFLYAEELPIQKEYRIDLREKFGASIERLFSDIKDSKLEDETKIKLNKILLNFIKESIPNSTLNSSIANDLNGFINQNLKAFDNLSPNIVQEKIIKIRDGSQVLFNPYRMRHN